MVWNRTAVSTRGRMGRVKRVFSKSRPALAGGHRMAKRYIRKGVPRSVNMNPQPDYRMVKLRYVDTGVVTHGALGVLAIESWRANGAYDPYTPAGGHQPMHWDAYANLYDHYCVMGARATLRAWVEDADDVACAFVGIKLDDDNTIGTTIANLVEQKKGGTSYKILRSNSQGSNVVSLSKNFSARKFFGVKDPEDRDTIQATTNATPADQAYFNVFWGHCDGATVIPDLKYIITIDYIVKFSEPKDTAAN